MNTYTVLPFSGPKFQENERKLRDNETPCAICGKAVKSPYQHSAVVVGGGDWAKDEKEACDETDAGYMGTWGIGPDCHRKYLAKSEELRENGKLREIHSFVQA